MQQYQQYAREVQTTLDSLPWGEIEKTSDLINHARRDGRQVFIFGNGGSASTASHFACDLSKNTAIHGQPRLRVMALTDNQALLTAYSNDCGYENVFAEQLTNFLNDGDVVLAISASGNSPNVLNAIQVAKERGAKTIGWSGYHGGQLSQIVDVPVVINNHCIEQIEDLHLLLGHMVTTAVRDECRLQATVLNGVNSN